MALKRYKPTTPGRRGLVLVDRSELHKGKPVKALTKGLTKSGGRNNHGRITARRRGGGAKRSYRMVDFKRRRFEAATVERLEYDPNRSAFIALIKYADGDPQMAYELAKLLHTKFDAYKDSHSNAIGWAMDRQVFAWIVPYDEGAVRYFNEIGAWSAAHEANNQALLERQRVLAAAWAGGSICARRKRFN